MLRPRDRTSTVIRIRRRCSRDRFVEEFSGNRVRPDRPRRIPDECGTAVYRYGNTTYRGRASESPSDVDFVILADEPAQHLSERRWTQIFGEVLDQQVEEYGNLTSLRVRYADGLDVEYGFTDVTWPQNEGGRAVVAAGMKMLYERTPLLNKVSLS